MNIRQTFLRNSLLTLAVLSALASHNFAITFDSTFGNAGKFLTTFGDTGLPSTTGARVHIQPSGRIVVVGRHQQDGAAGRMNGIVLAGLTTAGVLDNTYGTGGKVFNWSFVSSRYLVNSAMLPDGSIQILYQFVQPPSTDFPGVIRYTPDGIPDSGFKADIRINTGVTTPLLMAVGSGNRTYVLIRQDDNDFLVRLNPDGSRDTTFGPDGVRPLNLKRIRGNDAVLTGMLELPSGKLILTSRQTFSSTGSIVSMVARLDGNGNLDRSFGTQGVVRLSRDWGNLHGMSLGIQPDGKIVIGGLLTITGSWAILMRLTDRGRPDASFGTGGYVQTAFNDWNTIFGIGVTADGKIIVAGHCGSKLPPANERLFVARFSPSGVRESFVVTNFISGRDAAALDVATQPDGRIVIAAFTVNEALTARQLAAARFLQ